MRLLRSAVVGVRVALACFVPPIVHFVSGPLSPALGGFVAGMRLRSTLDQAAALGALMAGLMLVAAGAIAAVASVFVPNLLAGASWTIGAVAVGGAYLYVFWLATLGAWAGGAFARRSEATAMDAAPPAESDGAGVGADGSIRSTTDSPTR